ncbi:MAG: hypothetical protein HRT71_10895 [Flavobacteriales bacterium]|nr:hypothetical protein [Flavobacteriales bacterium]
MLIAIRKSKISKVIAAYLMLSFVLQIIQPSAAFALTGGPSQPEVQSFEPIGTSEMVNLSSGDFTYNIPLLDVGGYPINISYHSGITMDQEASWVGLGWNINPGVINRNVRTLPDDFNGDKIKREFSIKDNFTVGLTYSPKVEFLGKKINAVDKLNKKVGLNLGISYNNYTGVGMSAGVTFGVGPATDGLNASLGLSVSSESGVGVSTKVSYMRSINDAVNTASKGGSIGLGYNSRRGLTQLTMRLEGKKEAVNADRKIVEEQGAASNYGISFATPSYTPSGRLSRENYAISFGGSYGAQLGPFALSGELRGSVSGQRLSADEVVLGAYGYLNSQNIPSNPLTGALMDFNREKDGAHTKNRPNLPLANYSYDVYGVSGQGVGGVYRPFRPEVGTVHDNIIFTTAMSGDLPTIETGQGNLFKIGSDFSTSQSIGFNGAWKRNNDAARALKFKRPSNTSGLYENVDEEPFYFKQLGELTPEADPDFFDKIGGFDPVRVSLKGSGKHVTAIAELSVFKNEDQSPGVIKYSSLDIKDGIVRKKRQSRNQPMNMIFAKDAPELAMQKFIEDYDPSFTITGGKYGKEEIPRNSIDDDGLYRNSHISEVSIVRGDGARYIYGIPAYNSEKQEVTFAVNPDYRTPDCYTGLIEYNPEKDVSKKNKNGLDHYFERITTPGYAHSYLLTSIVSADYVDVTLDGPTDDDLGSYTKINYTRVHGGDNPFNWRVPFAENMANHSEGLKSKRGKKGDDKATYLYGEKEVWYMHSIETKTHIAEFHTANRMDAFGVTDTNGGRVTGSDSASDDDANDENNAKLLEKIELYAKHDRLNNTDAVPLKTIHFKYSYSLCKGLPNNLKNLVENNGDNTDDDDDYDLDAYGNVNEGGKLTLTEIYFTYGKSFKGKLNPYQFNYGEMDNTPTGANKTVATINPNYNMKGYDRWGSFKPNDEDCNEDYYPLRTDEFPYVEQGKVEELDKLRTADAGSLSNNEYAESTTYPDRTWADVRAVAWNLSSINLPSGGTIEVDYEADDYGYVQDKRAMEMCKVVGAVREEPEDHDDWYDDINKNKLFEDNGVANEQESRSYLIIELNKPFVGLGLASEFKKHYLNNADGSVLEDLYFRFLLDVNKRSDILQPKFEFVSGYLANARSLTYGFVPNESGNIYTHAWIKLEEQEIDDLIKNDPKVNPISKAGWNFTKLYLPRVAYHQNDPANSSVDAIFDGLFPLINTMVQAFEGFQDNARRIGHSQSFVPGNAWLRFYSPNRIKKGGGHRVAKVVMKDEWASMTTENTYQTATYGQEYNYTTIENGDTISSGVAAYEPNLGNDENPFRQPKTYSEKPGKFLVPSSDFYIEQPLGESFFPGARISYGKVAVKNIEHTNVNTHAKGKVVTEFYTSKDFPVIVSETPMDAKPFNTNPVLKFLKIVNKEYLTVTQGYAIELNNMDGKLKSQKVYAHEKSDPVSGVEYTYKTTGGKRLSNKVDVISKDGTIKNVDIGIDIDMVADSRESNLHKVEAGAQVNLDVFWIGPFLFPAGTMWPNYFSEKVRFRSMTTTKVINRAGILDETRAFDLSSSVSTYDRLYDAQTGAVVLTETTNQYEDPIYAFNYPAHWAYDRMGPAYQNIDAMYRLVNLSENLANQNMVEGDEVAVDIDDVITKGWVTRIPNTSELALMDADGNWYNSEHPVKVIRSGHRNISASVGSVVTLKNPVKKNALSFEKVLSAGVTEFNDNGKADCNCNFDITTLFNPFLAGTKGNFRPLRSWMYLTDRIQTRTNGQVDLRNDGVYDSFDPFWTPTDGGDWSRNKTGWTSASRSTMHLPSGQEIESKDTLNRYSSVQYGFSNNHVKAVAANAEYREIGYDGFEDHDFSECGTKHFSYKGLLDVNGDPVSLSSDYSHSGRKSLKITPSNSIELKKTFECPVQ